MAQSVNVVQKGGVGFAGLLTIVFVVLKLTAVIDWAWIWVLAPLWIPVGIVVVVLIALFIGAIIKLAAEQNARNKKVKS